jgi:hypothetical protein
MPGSRAQEFGSQLEEGVIGTFVQLPCFRSSGVMRLLLMQSEQAGQKIEQKR